MEMGPAAVALSSSWLVDVTIASAMFVLVSDTRVIGVPTSSTADRPTSIVMGIASSSVSAAATDDEAIALGRIWARSVVESSIVTIKIGATTRATRRFTTLTLFICYS